jgi:hypothetical protein
LSKTIQARIVTALKSAWDQPPGVFATFARLIGRAGGRPRYWRLR